MRFAEYPKNVHTIIASHLRKRAVARKVNIERAYAVHWLSALQLRNPEIAGWLDPELSASDEAELLILIKEGIAEIDEAREAQLRGSSFGSLQPMQS